MLLSSVAIAQRLDADSAILSDGLTVKTEREGRTIHKWNNISQSISWRLPIRQGNYEVFMRYSEPYPGCAVKVQADGREIVSLLRNTDKWGQYRTSSLGVITIKENGNHTITLSGIQNSLRNPSLNEKATGRNGAGEPKHEEAFPDLSYLEFTATDKPATDNAVGLSTDFKGKPLFDGKSFCGWEGNNGKSSEQWFRIENGTIVAGSLNKPIPQNEFLRTDRKYSNFELRLKFKIVDPENKGWNGGIQFRSMPNPDVPHEMIGYQADIIKKRWGGLYDEQRRWCFLGSILSEQDCRWNDWNEYVLRCEGPRIRLWLNKKAVVDYIEPYAYRKHPVFGIIPDKGYIALQIHERKNPYEVWYKDIEIEELKVPAPVQRQSLNAAISDYHVSGLLAPGVPSADSLGWKIGIQAYDFKRIGTFFDAIRQTSALGLHYIEGVGMQLASGTDIQFGPDMPEQWIDSLKQELINHNVILTSYYRRINGLKDPEGAEKTFRFCRDMGIVFVTDPIRVEKGNGSMDYYEALAEKYGVQMVLTNHPESDGSPYYDPEVVLKDLQGRSLLLGASVDIGHFMRDGRNALEIVDKYIDAGRMYHFHLRDVDGCGKKACDVPIGQGKGNIRDIFNRLRKADIRPLLIIEYEHDMYNPMLDIIPAIYGIEKCLIEN